MTDWHLIHLGQLALSGAALLTIEATACLPEGRSPMPMLASNNHIYRTFERTESVNNGFQS
jgi:2,4-dienoyl-CoA reductase-like NADH-dependent reductase (Old Yellow Enzyme family)